MGLPGLKAMGLKLPVVEVTVEVPVEVEVEVPAPSDYQMLVGADGYTVLAAPESNWEPALRVDPVTWAWHEDGVVSGDFSAGDDNAVVTDVPVVSYDSKLWRVGGNRWWTGRESFVYNSTNGKDWVLVTADGGFPARSEHAVCVHNNQLVLSGGKGPNGQARNDLWTSSDGVTWTQRNASCNWQTRKLHQMISYNGFLWVIGGSNNTSVPKNDVWKSDDLGVTWTQVTASADFSARQMFGLTVHNNKLVLACGLAVSGEATVRSNEIWSSTDGETWTLVTDSAPFVGRIRPSLLTYKGLLILYGGAGSESDSTLADQHNDFWWSADGVHWTAFCDDELALPPYFPTENDNSYYSIAQVLGDRICVISWEPYAGNTAEISPVFVYFDLTPVITSTPDLATNNDWSAVIAE